MFAPIPHLLLAAVLTGCGGPEATEATEPAVPSVPAPPTDAAPSPPALVPASSGWGAVFWREGAAYRVGGGDVAIGPAGAARVSSDEAAGPCGGTRLSGAPDRAVVTLPGGPSLPTIDRPPAIAAALVERAAWRIDEVLPARDPFSPVQARPAPAQSRGVEVGSVAKVRRPLAPPILLSVGVRDCHGAVVVLDADAENTLSSYRLQDTCETMRLIPPADYDGDGKLELVAWNETRVAAFRVEVPGNRLQALGDWSCSKTGED